MIQKQRYLWPIDCPNELTDVPRCWNASLNLGNEKHNDNYGVSNNKESSETSWYLLFPEWEVAIELCHGTWISWNGKICGHCSAIPNLAGGVQLISLFCSIPSFCNTFCWEICLVNWLHSPLCGEIWEVEAEGGGC
jgi:hypothetical protein